MRTSQCNFKNGDFTFEVSDRAEKTLREDRSIHSDSDALKKRREARSSIRGEAMILKESISMESLHSRRDRESEIAHCIPRFFISFVSPSRKKANKAPEPTPRPVTIPAEPGIAPGRSVAHL